MKKYRKLALPIIISLFLVFVYHKYTASEYIIPKNILILKSQSENDFSSQECVTGITSVFKTETREIQCYIEDISKNNRLIYMNLTQYINFKYKDIKFDLIIVVDQESLDFLKKGANNLGDEIPILGITMEEDLVPPILKQYIGMTQVNIGLENVRFMKSMQPKLKKIYVFYDLDKDRIVSEMMIAKYKKSINVDLEFIPIKNIENYPFEDLPLQETSLFILPLEQSMKGQTLTIKQYIKYIQRFYKGPMYSCSEEYIQQGVVGGKVVSSHEQGVKVAKVGLNILYGTAFNSLKEIYYTGTPIINYNAAIKCGIGFENIPYDIRVTNRDLDYFVLNKESVRKFFVYIILLLIFVIIVLIMNILQRKRTEYLLRKSKVTYKELLIGIPNTVILLENETLKFINPFGIDFLGGTNKEEITYDKLKEMAIEHIDYRNIGAFPTRIETRIRTLRGDIKEVEIIIVVDNKGTDDKSIIILIQDISHRKMLYESMERDKIRSEFFANLSHEFKTPINLMLSTSKLLEQTQNREKDIKRILPKAIRIIKQNSYRLIRLVNNIMDAMMIEGDHTSLNLHNYNIVELTEDVTLSIIKYAKQNNIEVVFDTEIEELEIALDRDKYERIILNLLSNAIKYNKIDGDIIVDIHRIDNDVVISVKDTGIGISAEVLPHIFERFMQANKSLIRNVEGSGLGLTLVKSFVELHKGKIEVRSKKGVGTEMALYFPIYTIENEKKSAENEGWSKHKIQNTKIELSDIYINE